MHQNEPVYGPLTLFVHPEINRLDAFSLQLSQSYEKIAVGKELSAYLISSIEGNQPLAARHWLQSRIASQSSEPAILIDIDILFHPTLKLDVLNLMRQISRQRKLIVLWPGSYRGGVLSYGQPGHNHYKFWKDLHAIRIMGVGDAL